jgi:hypothetical protein
MLGQFFPLWPLGAAFGAAWLLPVVDWLDVVPLEDVLVEAALAIAAPPPATAAVTARVVRNGLSRWDIGFTSFAGLPCQTRSPACV